MYNQQLFVSLFIKTCRRPSLIRPHFLELVKEFTMKLEDTVAEKDSDVTFTCKVSDEDMDVTWLIDSQSLPESDKYSVVSEDVTHTLTIRDVQPKDSCDVTAQFGDQSTIAKLSVAGEFTLYLRVVECSCFPLNKNIKILYLIHIGTFILFFTQWHL